MVHALISLNLGLSIFAAGAAAQPAHRLVRLPMPGLHMYGGVSCARNGWFGGYSFGWQDGSARRKATVWKLDGTMKDLHPDGAGNSHIFATNGIGFVGQFQPGDFSGTHAMHWKPETPQPTNLQPGPPFPNSHGYAMSNDHQGGLAYSFVLTRAAFWSGTAESFVDLQPEGYDVSHLYGMTEEYQVGHVALPRPDRRGFAIIWYGSNDRYRIIGPEDAEISEALGCYGDVQVGYVKGSEPESRPRACLWRGTRESRVDLHPKGPYSRSYALATNGSTQVGVGRVPEGADVRLHALVWSGSAWSFLDLHETVKDFATDSEALCIDEEGNIGGRIQLRGHHFTIPVVWTPR